MKMKVKEHNGAITLLVSGAKQQLIITEEDGYFVIEVAGSANDTPAQASVPTPVPIPAHVSAPATAPVCVQEDEQEPATYVPPQSDDDLFKKLTLLRKTLAIANEVPPYLIFHDKTLHEMVEKMPMNMQAMGHIAGVGQAKLEKYGPLFLDAISGSAA